jgi:serine/threonine protein kinase
MLEKTINQKENTKIQLVIENMLKKKYKLFYKKAIMQEFKEEDLLDLKLFYMKERNNRLVYNDQELHALLISLVICLIITPSRGTLDDLYCPPLYDFNKINILYILHHHLNHQDNQEILPELLKLVAEINPYGSGQRLLKLLCTNLFDSTFYKGWERIGFGVSGKVFQCTTSLEEPAIVAIKKIDTPENIYDPCHLVDIFTEITALETFRLEGCVTHLFDYGVDNDAYYIVMKKYQMSLKEWRNQQTKPLSDMLFIYLNIFKDILKAFSTIHFYKTTHYDIKCDNIVIDFTSLDDSLISEENNSICVKIADFGECKMFIDEEDEYCIRSRGTDVIKSPEMLMNYGYNVKKDADNFDRRKKLGTTRASDIWSLGCLFYELLTGKFLFEEIETGYIAFMIKANTLPITELLTDDKLNELNNNPYLIDFLKYMLVTDQTYRPNIEAIIKRFDHVHALLANISSGSNSNTMHLSKRFNHNIDQCLDICTELLVNSVDNNIANKSADRIKYMPSILKISEDMYLCDYHFAENNFSKLYSLGITHVISWCRSRNKELSERLLFLNLLEGNGSNANEYEKNSFAYIFKVMDFIRHCMIYKGCILFIDDYQFQGIQAKPNYLIRSLIILAVSFILNLNAYDTWTYINSKLLYFQIPVECLSNLSTWVLNQTLIYNTVFSHPVIRCLCGACVLVLKRSYSGINNSNFKTCSCSSRNKNTEYSDCPSNGCMNYIQDIKVTFILNFRIVMELIMKIYSGLFSPLMTFLSVKTNLAVEFEILTRRRLFFIREVWRKI